MIIQFLPHAEFHSLSSERRVERILLLVQENKLLLIEGRLESHEETTLIRRTMESITEQFHGIELAVIDPKVTSFQERMQRSLARLIGIRHGMTIIDPAPLIKEMTHDPEKMHVLIEATP
jgi:hypothetical protein